MQGIIDSCGCVYREMGGGVRGGVPVKSTNAMNR